MASTGTAAPNQVAVMGASVTPDRLESPHVNKYNIAAHMGGTGFEVQIVGTNGARQTILGFATEAEAQAWIAQDQRLTRAADPFRVESGRLGKS